MRRAVGIFLIIQSLLTYIIVDALCDPFKIKEKTTAIDLDTGVTSVSYSYRLPGIYSLSCVILIITFILGIYFILTRKKKRELKDQYFYG